MADATELLKLIKQAANDANSASKPVNVVFGTVIAADPLQVQLEQKIILEEDQLIVPEYLTDHDVDIHIGDWETEESEEHKHKITGDKKVTVLNALKAEDTVIMIRQQGGQQFLVIDRLPKEK